ncbi:MAG TPA: UDP-N-acetylmuramyl pentapeptide phosphotransferase [Actinobacteria bacterium]|nr:UDP-N-acetylmuramyl pentapeptide phosphotransferase [Actinomycetota bacterium]
MQLFFSTLIVSIVLTLIFYSPIMRMLSGANCTKPNYRKHYVVNSFGIMLPIIILMSSALFGIQFFARTGTSINSPGLLLLLSLVMPMSFVGFIDDLLGTRLIGGFRGHFSQLRFGILTTGTLKAIIGFSVSATIAAFVSGNIFDYLINVGVLVLSINVLNLFDLRPGRAIKIFSLSVIATFIASWTSSFWSLWGLIIPPVAGLLWGDLKEQSMMGDVGSNSLGAILGLAFVINLSQTANLIILIVLAVLHLITERYSLSKFIEKAPLIKQFDELGVKR